MSHASSYDGQPLSAANDQQSEVDWAYHGASFIEAIPGLVAVLAPDGRVERVNREIEDYCGHGLDQLREWGTNGIVHPDDMPDVARVFSQSLAAGTPYTIEQRLRRHDGAYRWFDNHGRPRRAADGSIVAWHVLLVDVHDRKLAEQALKASEQSLQLTIDTIPALAWSARSDGTADFFNRHYLDYVGLPIEKLLGWQWTSAVHPDDQQLISDAWDRFSMAGPSGNIEARVRRHDGTYRWFSFRAHPQRDEQGNVVKWFGVQVDIDEQKRATMLLAGERQLLELIASGQPLQEVLAKLCSVVEAALPDFLCEVRTLDASRTVFERIEAPSFPTVTSPPSLARPFPRKHRRATWRSVARCRWLKITSAAPPCGPTRWPGPGFSPMA